ncbi:hypothetical protein [Streptomyces sp. NPDC002566]|uniref:cupin domain-containing protein n=1 Tax=Streptomyces sp. NPDC002566 TaxID=3364650 RepID=UPI003679D73F
MLFEGNDVEALDEVVTEEFSPHRLRVGRGQRAPGRFRRLHRRGLALYELGWGAPVEVAAGELPDFYNVHVPLAGDGTVRVAGREVMTPCSVAGPGTTPGMSLSAGGHPHHCRVPYGGPWRTARKTRVSRCRSRTWPLRRERRSFEGPSRRCLHRVYGGVPQDGRK